MCFVTDIKPVDLGSWITDLQLEIISNLAAVLCVS